MLLPQLSRAVEEAEMAVMLEIIGDEADSSTMSNGKVNASLRRKTWLPLLEWQG